MRHLYTFIMLLGLCITQVAAQQLPETFVVVIGQVEGFKDGKTFTVMESVGDSGSLFFHKSIPDDNGTIKNGRFTAIYPYQRKVTGRFELILPELSPTTNLPLIFYANPGDTVYIQGKGAYPCNGQHNQLLPSKKIGR